MFFAGLTPPSMDKNSDHSPQPMDINQISLLDPQVMISFHSCPFFPFLSFPYTFSLVLFLCFCISISLLIIIATKMITYPLSITTTLFYKYVCKQQSLILIYPKGSINKNLSSGKGHNRSFMYSFKDFHYPIILSH